MNRNTEPSRERAPDELDALLASRPARPSADFVSATLARIALDRDTAISPEVETLLAARPARVSPGFAERVLAAVAAERRRRFVTLRVLAPSLAAACLALVALPFLAGHRASSSTADRVAAALAADPELRELAALPSSASSALADTRTRDLAAFADIDAALSSSSTEYAYGI